MLELHGRCLCGAVAYTVPDALHYAGYCHCSDCRRFSGSASSAFGGVARADFRIVRGTEHIRHYHKSENTVLGFCDTCGSSLYADKPLRGMIHIRLGTLDQAPGLRPQFHSYVGSKAEWDAIGDGLPCFEAGRTPAKPA
jgi:hypothetical protein